MISLHGDEKGLLSIGPRLTLSCLLVPFCCRLEHTVLFKNPSNRRTIPSMPAHQALVRKISRSQILSDYEIAFVAASGLPMRFQPVGETESNELPLQNHSAENQFCALLSQTHEGCKMCKEVDRKLLETGDSQPRTELCIAGLADTAVPVMIQGRLAGYLRTGQVALEQPKRQQFTKLARTLMDWGLKTNLTQVEEAWLHSKVLAPAQYEAFIQLLKVFARHIGLAAEQFGAEPHETESPLIQKARHYIEAHQQEDLHVNQVANILNISVFYFCKVFRKATGKTFTEYLSEVRVAKAKHLLQNPHIRVSEVAFEAGFQSITHFNRIFRKLTGENPTDFRANFRRA
jgi:AraC-like DNA-binding protein/ligand-binding sensor protein